ncbi:hypothetical protein [Bordetella avium]|uniref:hypothetical protein n=1 Tax=Bordetella avium TaxID=521 RepID=UPI00068C732A|nr:hypothetical protein [Bordetella avium]
MSYVLLARIRRDAHTMTPVTIRPHELAILQTIHGEDNVHTLAGRVMSIKDLSADDVAHIPAPVSDEEFDRLASKYGSDEGGLLVEQVYGKRASGGLESAIERTQAAAAKLLKASPEGGDPGASTARGGRRRAAAPEGVEPGAETGQEE